MLLPLVKKYYIVKYGLRSNILSMLLHCLIYMAICSKSKACSIHTETILMKNCLPSHFWKQNKTPKTKTTRKIYIIVYESSSLLHTWWIDPTWQLSIYTVACLLLAHAQQDGQENRTGVKQLMGWNKDGEITHQIVLQPEQTWLEEFKLIY